MKEGGKNDGMVEWGGELWNPICDVLTIPMRRNKMATIDRKFKFTAISNKSGKKYTEKNALVFLLKDALLPDLLDEYYTLAKDKCADERQLLGIQLLKERVVTWQRKNINKVHVPDVEPGKEEQRVCKPNK